MELREQLTEALGSTYRVEKELGGGGMSRVFLAEETGLGRQVVIKVLPPEMAAGVNQERFRREVQLAARLQHPHIVPLLTAGAAGDLLYYVMPYIKGESLRARLGREGELPVGETVRILREVIDGLAHAHGEGVVHRDIKPDNVMISGGHALVTDFGVAKAVSESAGGTSLTSLGLAIGTPAYMAPEQASGDPHVDHRADLYAVGAMAFEMLTGRPPFQGPNPQAVLMAHVTQAPEAVSQLRTTVPPGLNTVVMRCLEKRAADRWQTASELLPQLDLLLTPSTGGIEPTSATPHVSTGTQAALRRSHPVRVVVTFILASLGVLGVVWLLVQQLGLPDWVLYGAIVLLLAGLPIIILTGRHERERAVARTTNVYLAAPTGIRRFFTWQRAIAGGALAFAGLGVLTIVYTAMRLLGIGTVGTLMAKGTLAERDRIVLAEFENRTADSTLGFTVTELLRTDLAQSRVVSVYDASQLADVLARMALPRGTQVTFEIAREAAARQGLKAVLAGEITSIGNAFVVAGRLVATQDGEVLWAGRENVADADQLASAVDRLSAALRERVGESLRTIRSDPPLYEVTTRSMAALRLYAQAQRANNARDFDGALALLDRAIAEDSTFAMALRFYGVIVRNRRVGDSARYMPALTRAFELRNRLSTRERYQTEGSYYLMVPHDTASAVAAYRALLDLHPDDNIGANNLGIIYRSQNRDREALELYKATIREGTAGAVTYANAIPVALRLEGLDSVRSLIDAYVSAYPENSVAWTRRADYLMAIRQFDSARVLLERRRDEVRGNPPALSAVLDGLSRIALAQGRPADSERLQEEAARLTAETSQPFFAPMTPAQFVETQVLGYRFFIALRALGDTGEAVRLLDRRYAIMPLAELARQNPFWYFNAARDYATAGRAATAQRYWRQWEATVSDSVRSDPPSGALVARAALAHAEGRYDDAIGDIRRALSACETCRYGEELATIFASMGRYDSARVHVERLLDEPVLGLTYTASEAAIAAEWYVAAGDTAGAVRFLQSVVDEWKDADPVLQPRVEAARARLQALGRR